MNEKVVQLYGFDGSLYLLTNKGNIWKLTDKWQEVPLPTFKKAEKREVKKAENPEVKEEVNRELLMETFMVTEEELENTIRIAKTWMLDNPKKAKESDWTLRTSRVNTFLQGTYERRKPGSGSGLGGRTVRVL